jgi:hypothetical protein
MSRKLREKAHHLLSQERQILPLPEFKDRGAELSIALAYPNRYYTAMSNLGFQAVYWLFNQIPGTVCQRAFLPDPEDIPEYHRTETPLFSLESQRPLRSFDILAFSVSTNDYPLHDDGSGQTPLSRPTATILPPGSRGHDEPEPWPFRGFLSDRK